MKTYNYQISITFPNFYKLCHIFPTSKLRKKLKLYIYSHLILIFDHTKQNLSLQLNKQYTQLENGCQPFPQRTVNNSIIEVIPLFVNLHLVSFCGYFVVVKCAQFAVEILQLNVFPLFQSSSPDTSTSNVPEPASISGYLYRNKLQGNINVVMNKIHNKLS